MANINDSHFGEGFNEASSLSNKQKRNIDAKIDKAHRQAEKDLKKHEIDSDKAFVKSEKRRIRDLNREIRKHEGLVEENGYLVYRTTEKFKREKPEKPFKTPATGIGRPFRHFMRFISWLKSKIGSFFASLFQKRKSVMYTDGTPIGEGVDEKNSPENKEEAQDKSKDRGEPTISDPIKLLYTAPLSQENLLGEGTKEPDVNIISEFRDFMEKQGMDADQNKHEIMYFLATKLTQNQPISEQNISDVAKYVTGYECSFDIESKSFLFTMDTSDGNVAGVLIGEDGTISVPEYIPMGDKLQQNPIYNQPFNNENIASFAAFLNENPNYINAVVMESLVSKTDLAVVKAYINDNPELNTMVEMVKEFEETNHNEEVFAVLNKTMARMSYTDGVSPETVFKYGFEEPSRIVPEMKNPTDYVVALRASQKYITEGMTYTNAAILSNAYIVNPRNGDPVLAVTDNEKIALIDMHIHQMCQRGLPAIQMVNLIETYNACVDTRSMKIAIEQINAQLNNKTFVNDIIAQKHPVQYTDKMIAEDIMKSMATQSQDELIGSYNNGANTSINAYIKALSFDELIRVTEHMPDSARKEFNMLVSSTKGEPERPDAGDMVLNDGYSTSFIDDGKENGGNETRVYRSLDDNELS